MSDVLRVPVALNGWFGAPGVNVLHFANPGLTAWTDEDYTNVVNLLHAAYGTNPLTWANGVTFTIPDVAQVFNDATGELKYAVTCLDPNIPIYGTGVGSESRATQALLRLLTADVLNNRFVQGRIFLGPAASALLGGDGLIAEASRADIEDNFSVLVDLESQHLVVWHLPVEGAGGSIHDVRSISVRDRPGTLRGRNR